MTNADVCKTIVQLDVCGSEFTLVGREVLNDNYLEVARWDITPDVPIGNLALGQVITVKLAAEEDRSGIIEPHTEDSLVEEMLLHQLATSGTCKQHLSDMFSKKLIKRQGNHLVPSWQGGYLCAAYDKVGASQVLGVELKRRIMSAIER